MSAVVSALAVALLITPVVIAVLRRLSVLDVPNARSSHRQPTVRGGGAGVAIAAVVGVSVAPAWSGSNRLGLLLAGIGFGLVGLAEDLIGIPPLPRFGLQLVAGAAAMSALLSGLTGPTAWRVFFVAGVLLWLVGYVNAFNFMDGINGISVAQVVVAGVAWYAIGTSEGVQPLAGGGLIVAGAALGFAPYNFPNARVFLGDVGSYFLGAWLAALAVIGVRAGLPPEAVLAPLALYTADTAVTLVKRMARHEPWHLPHRDHTYQRLVRLGWSHPTTTLVVSCFLAASSALGAVSLGDSLALRIGADVALVALLAGYLALPWIITRRKGQTARRDADPDCQPLLPSRDRSSASPPQRARPPLDGGGRGRDGPDRAPQPSDRGGPA